MGQVRKAKNFIAWNKLANFQNIKAFESRVLVALSLDEIRAHGMKKHAGTRATRRFTQRDIYASGTEKRLVGEGSRFQLCPLP
jgi:hypothetical protein